MRRTREIEKQEAEIMIRITMTIEEMWARRGQWAGPIDFERHL